MMTWLPLTDHSCRRFGFFLVDSASSCRFGFFLKTLASPCRFGSLAELASFDRLWLLLADSAPCRLGLTWQTDGYTNGQADGHTDTSKSTCTMAQRTRGLEQ